MKRPRPQWIPVVIALIQRDSKVLMGQRPEEKSLPGVWEFPGGKIENGESPEQALKRELKEELSIDAEIGDLKFAATHNYGETGIILLFYLVSFWKGEVKSVHHKELQWVEPVKIAQLPLPDANKIYLQKILHALKT